jgi:hypothetical protein
MAILTLNTDQNEQANPNSCDFQRIYYYVCPTYTLNQPNHQDTPISRDYCDFMVDE